MAEAFKNFNMEELMEDYLAASAPGSQDMGEAACKQFLGGQDLFSKLKIDLTNAQHVMNQHQNLPGKILVFDTRSQYQYHLGHVENSINILKARVPSYDTNELRRTKQGAECRYISDDEIKERHFTLAENFYESYQSTMPVSLL